MLTRFAVLAGLTLVAAPAVADDAAECSAAITSVAKLVATMPDGDLSRRFAETELRTARIEMESGETDGCEDYVARAHHIMITRPYVLRPGETLGFPPAR